MFLTIVLILILVLLIVAVAAYVRRVNRRTPEKPPAAVADDCCGAHAVCERDTLLSSTDEIVYFDDEELDVLRGKPSEMFSDDETAMVEEVFVSLREQDVSGWVRSMSLRGIELPESVRDQALMVIAERRENTLKHWQETHR